MIATGLLLAAGQGTRLRSVTPYKPLCPVAGRALIDHAIDGMAAAGLSRVIVTLGYGADAIAAHLAARDWPVEVLTVLPVTMTIPGSATSAVAILPTTTMVTPVPMDTVLVGAVWNFPEIAVRAPEAARISSDTLARTRSSIRSA